MKTHLPDSGVNIERRIRKHIYAQPQTFEVAVPPGFLELCERVLLRIASDMPGAEKSEFKIKKKNGRLQIENAPFELCHDLLFFGLPFADVKILVFRGRCSNDEKLQSILDAIEWDLWIPSDISIDWDLRVDSSRSQLYNESRIKEKVKKTLQARFKNRNQNKSKSDSSPLELGLDFRLERESLEVLLSLGGRNYWQRGHKKDLRHAAPLREDLAGCIVQRLADLHSEWSSTKHPSLVWNPFCGTGTLLYEAALNLSGIARLDADKLTWSYPHLPFFKGASFQHRAKKVGELISSPAKKPQVIHFLGEEKNPEVIEPALRSFSESGLVSLFAPKVEIISQDSTQSGGDNSSIVAHECVWLLANPPFGLRLSNSTQGGTEKLYRAFAQRIHDVGNAMLASNKVFSGVVLCATEENWLTLKKTLSGWRQRCEHFTLGGLDIRAFYF
jgi:23S rRNA G2445 N2-methylase RlmL